MVEPVNIRCLKTAQYRRHAAAQRTSVANAVKCARQFNASTVELAVRTQTTNIAACAPRDIPEFIAKLIDAEIIVKIMDVAT